MLRGVGIAHGLGKSMYLRPSFMDSEQSWELLSKVRGKETIGIVDRLSLHSHLHHFQEREIYIRPGEMAQGFKALLLSQSI